MVGCIIYLVLPLRCYDQEWKDDRHYIVVHAQKGHSCHLCLIQGLLRIDANLKNLTLPNLNSLTSQDDYHHDLNQFACMIWGDSQAVIKQHPQGFQLIDLCGYLDAIQSICCESIISCYIVFTTHKQS